MHSSVVTLSPDERLDVANDIMSLGRIRHMPVVAGDRVVGILTQRDLFRAAISSVLNFRPAAEREWLQKIHVSEVRAQPVVTAQPAWTVRRAVEVMTEHVIDCLPVVDGGQLVGLLSESDCLRLLVQMLRPPTLGPRS
ncbi:MAG: CBS domain-containing protein [bacterium]